MSAQTAQTPGAKSEAIAIMRAAVEQIVAHVRHNSMQRAIAVTSCSRRLSVAQCSQATMQSLQA